MMTNRLKAFRHLEEILQPQLADMLGVSRQSISALENGTRQLKCDFSSLGYSDERMRDLPEMSMPLHRHRVSTSEKGKRKAMELLRLGGELFSEFRVTSNKVPSYSASQYGLPFPNPEDYQQLEEYALEIRQMIFQVPVDEPIKNLTTKVEQLGICIIPINVAGIDGLSAFVGEDRSTAEGGERQPVIGLSPEVSGERFRFTLAHELAHLFIHVNKDDDTENQANYLAGALLFPEEPFREAMASIEKNPSLKNFVLLKRTWGVSVAAMIYRAKELKIISADRFRSLQIQKASWKKSEPEEKRPEYPTLLKYLIDQNNGVEAVSKRYGINARHIEWLVDWPSALRLVN